MKAPPDASTRPRVFAGRYELGEPIGRGGMGVVYAAHDRRLDRPVAIKLLGDGFAEHHAEREARAAARLVHPNVVVVLDVGVDGDRPFIVMERLEGVTLADELRNGSMPEDHAIALGTDVLAALGAAHAMGIVHGDVKPGNVLRAGDRWKVADFGIARSVDDTTGSITGDPLGSPSYVAPERLDARPSTPRGDIYGAGVILYEALAGVRPFEGDDVWAVTIAVREGRFEPLASRRPDLDPSLLGAIERAMALDPADRFASADEMASALPRGVPRVLSEPTVRLAPIEATARLPEVRTEREVVTPPLVVPETDERQLPPSRTARRSAQRRPARRLAAIAGGLALVFLIATLVITLMVGGQRAPAGLRHHPKVTPAVGVSLSMSPTAASPTPSAGSPGQGDEHGNANGFENGQGNKHDQD